MPTDADIQALEGLLPTFMAASDEAKRSGLLANLSGYGRQYLGYLKDGQRQIYVNAFCPEYWARNSTDLNRLVIVMDGGACFFKVHYNVGRRSFENLTINGEA